MALPERQRPPPRRRRRGRKAWAKPSELSRGGEATTRLVASPARRHNPRQGKGSDGDRVFFPSSQGSLPSAGKWGRGPGPLSPPVPPPQGGALVRRGAVTAFQGRGCGGSTASALLRQRREFPARAVPGGAGPCLFARPRPSPVPASRRGRGSPPPFDAPRNRPSRAPRFSYSGVTV